MLNILTARRRHPWYVTLLMPVPVLDALRMMFVPATLGIAAAVMMKDVVVLILALTVGYIAVIFFGRLFAEYEVNFRDKEDLECAVGLLDKTSALLRQGDSLTWTRKMTLPLLQSSRDSIRIFHADDGWIARGRKYDIIALASAINRIRRTT